VEITSFLDVSEKRKISPAAGIRRPISQTNNTVTKLTELFRLLSFVKILFSSDTKFCYFHLCHISSVLTNLNPLHRLSAEVGDYGHETYFISYYTSTILLVLVIIALPLVSEVPFLLPPLFISS